MINESTSPDDRSIQRALAACGVPIIALKRPRCPKCGALNRSPYRSDTDGETVTQRRRCAVCGQRFITICD